MCCSLVRHVLGKLSVYEETFDRVTAVMEQARKECRLSFKLTRSTVRVSSVTRAQVSRQRLKRDRLT